MLQKINNDNLYELQSNWIWSIASEVCSSVRDGTHDTPKYIDEGIPLITSKNLKENKIDFSDAKNISQEDHDLISVRSAVEKDDVLFAMIGTIGNPVVVNTDRVFSIKNVGLFKKNRKVLIPKYLQYWLSSYVFTQIIKNEGLEKGTNQKFIPLGHLRILPLALSPIAEQQRIVDKIEELFSDLDSGIDSLKTAQQQLKVYRQAVLKWAFEGKLTAQWREEQKRLGKRESTVVLLAQIKAEREQRYQQELEDWKTAIALWEANGKEGKRPGKPRSKSTIHISVKRKCLFSASFHKIGNGKSRATFVKV
jgi:type I restriction enzyme, S subunit